MPQSYTKRSYIMEYSAPVRVAEHIALAIMCRDFHRLRQLVVSCHFDPADSVVTRKDHTSMSLIELAVSTGNAEIAAVLLAAQVPMLMSQQIPKVRPRTMLARKLPLHPSTPMSARGQLKKPYEAIEYVVEKQSPARFAPRPLLHSALEARSISMLKLLVTEGADVNDIFTPTRTVMQSGHCGNPLHFLGGLLCETTSTYDFYEHCEDLAWCDTSLVSDLQRLPRKDVCDLKLHMAAMEVLLDAGCDVEARNMFGRSVYCCFLRHGNNEATDAIRNELTR